MRTEGRKQIGFGSIHDGICKQLTILRKKKIKNTLQYLTEQNKCGKQTNKRYANCIKQTNKKYEN